MTDLQSPNLLEENARLQQAVQQLETALAANDKKFQVVAELILDYVFQIDIQSDGTMSLAYVTNNFYAITGRAFTEVKDPQQWFSVFHPDDLPIAKRALQELMQTRRPVEIECRTMVPQSKYRWVQVAAKPIWDSRQNRVVSIIGAVKDISNRKRIEEELRQSEERFRQIAENISQILYTVTPDFSQFLYVSPSYETIWGKSCESLYADPNSWLASIHPQDRDRVEAVIDHNQGQGKYTTEYRVIRPTGEVRWVLDKAFELFKPDGNLYRVVGIIDDITDRKQQEAERAFTDRHLQKIQKLDAIGVLAGGIAHDFNNLLCGLFGYLELAKDCAAGQEELSGYLDEAARIFDRAKNLTQKLLTFSKGGRPSQKIMSLEMLIRKTVNATLSGTKVTANYQLANDLWLCKVDGLQIEQVISNIVLNACQAMPTGGTIVISAHNLQRGISLPVPLTASHYVRISIQDHGIGIPKENMPHLFEPFFTTKVNGNGLGLATAYSIVKKHDGYIEAESEAGKGATFRLYLPAMPHAQLSQDDYPALVDIKCQGNILLMDDEHCIREVSSKMLESMGYTVQCARHGQEAIDLFYNQAPATPFDLLILDLTVPGGLGGVETLARLLKIAPKVKAIASSGYSDDPVMADPTQYGFQAKLIKPYSKAEMLKVLRELLSANNGYAI